MKYGLIVFKETQNIGDDIQSYAAKQFLPKIDYYIERESMSTFISNNNEIVTTIMSGWYMHNPLSFPPSPYIKPLIISIHLTDYLKKMTPIYLDETGMKFLKNNTPILCRDTYTINNLKKVGIEGIFSGCLTLTLKSNVKIKKENKICIVDVPNEVEKHIKKYMSNEYKIDIKTHKLDLSINSLLSYEQRMLNVEKLLNDYQSCSLVITTRLHCALPCLALNIPVILIYDNNNNDIKNRLKDYRNYIKNYSVSEFVEIKNLDEFINMELNNNEVKQIAEKLEKICKNYIGNSNKTEFNNFKLDINDYLCSVQFRNNEILKKIVIEKEQLLQANELERKNFLLNEYTQKNDAIKAELNITRTELNITRTELLLSKQHEKYLNDLLYKERHYIRLKLINIYKKTLKRKRAD